MELAVMVLVAVPVVLIVLGAVILGQAAVSLHRRAGSRAAAALRLLAGAGLLGWALVSAAGLVVEMHYAVVVFPLLAVLGASVWALALLGAAGVLELRHRSRGRISSTGPVTSPISP